MHQDASGALNYGPEGIALIALALVATTALAALVVAFLENGEAGKRTAKFVFAIGSFAAAGQVFNGTALLVCIGTLAAGWAAVFFVTRRRRRSL